MRRAGDAVRSKLPDAPGGGLRGIAPFIFSALGGFLFGYDNGGIAGSLLFIRRGLGLTSFTTGVVVSSIIFGAFLAAGVAGKLTNAYGPRRLLMVAGLVLTIGSIGAALSVNAVMMVLARVVIGIGVGTATVQVPLYLSEMAPTRIRGALTSLFQVMIASGILVAFLVSYAFAGSGAWRIMLGLAAFPSLLLFGGMWLQPDSPRWLCLRGRVEEARAVLLQRRPPDEVERELADMKRTGGGQDVPLLRLLDDAKIRRGLLIAVAVIVLNDLSGITSVNYYAPTIFESAGFGASSAILISIGLGGLTLICTIIASLIVDTVGRRRLLLVGSAIMAIAMGALAVVFFPPGGLRGPAVLTAVGCIAVFKAAYALSWGPLIWVLLPELLPLTLRGRGIGLATTANWIATYLIVLLFPMLLDFGPAAVFLLFAACNLVALAFIFAMLRETARVSLEQLELGQADHPGATVSAASQLPMGH